MTMLVSGDQHGSSLSRLQLTKEQEAFSEQFEKWTESEQTDFVELLLSKMNHFQHSQINAYLKPMLQRDFISLLPSE